MKWEFYSAFITYDFWHKHIYAARKMGTENKKQARKRASQRIQQRDVQTNTVLTLDQHGLKLLVNEVNKRQEEYQNAAPGTIFTSTDRYHFKEAESGKTHTGSGGGAQFRYGVILEAGRYKINHFGGIVK